MKIRPFEISVPERDVRDLQRRLEAVRWIDTVDGSGWGYGSDLDFMRDLIEHWRTRFDWRAQEAGLNKFDHFMGTVEGHDIHFVQAKGNGPDPMPLLLSHGWPGSFFEMHELIPLLTDPAAHGGDETDAFDVVVPSLPGYIFSPGSARPGMHIPRIAELFDRLMLGLGYDRYGAHGGDIGAGVTLALGRNHAGSLAGIHVTSLALIAPTLADTAAPMTEDETAYLSGRQAWFPTEGAYAMVQATKPQTLSFGLNDSPVGLAAWISEKFRAWSDCDGDPENSFTLDTLLTNISLYWFSRSIASANRLYYENRLNPLVLAKDETIGVPTGLSVFPKDISLPPREWGGRIANLVYYNRLDRGGHFAALEEPRLLAEELRRFFRPLRTR